MVLLSSITRFQLPFSNSDGVVVGVLALAEAVSRAQDPLVADDGAAADVTIISEWQGRISGGVHGV
jgi:hypothetical protein